MSWLTQKEGIIDHSKMPGIIGTQPVRVLHEVTMLMFQNTHEKFTEKLEEAIKGGQLNPKVDLQLGEVPIAIEMYKSYRTPKFNHDTKQIMLHETFLSYQWCITYAIYTLFLETIDYPIQNKIAGNERYKISQENIDMAKEVFAYGKSLIALFLEWDKDALPNPEKYMAEKRDYVEQTNILYTEGMKFIMLHEFVHATKHPFQKGEHLDKSYYTTIEDEADSGAIEMIQRGRNPITRYAVESGPIFGIISILFFDSITTGKKHPNVEDRITEALKKLKVGDNEYCWSFACIGLMLWGEQFEIYFDWSLRGTVPYEYLYYDIIRQLKARG